MGGTFDDFLREGGIYEAVQTTATKCILAMQLAEAMKERNLTKVDGWAVYCLTAICANRTDSLLTPPAAAELTSSSDGVVQEVDADDKECKRDEDRSVQPFARYYKAEDDTG
jgi:hypothetical protein